jgi:hypothetical protein
MLAMSLVVSIAFVFSGANCLLQPPQTGSLRVLITDKPFPYDFIETAIVSIVQVEVRAASENEEDESGFLTVFESSEGKEFNLLELQNGKTDILADTTVPVGSYDQIRFIIEWGQVTLSDGRAYPLNVPSGTTSGIKLRVEFEVTGTGETTLLVDCDLAKAFHQVPSGAVTDVSQIQEFRFTPSVALRVIEQEEAGAVSGSVKSSTGLSLANASVTAYDASAAEITSTASMWNGTYQLIGLPPGTYTIEFSATGYDTSQVTGVEVLSGETTTNVNGTLTLSE